MSYNISKELLNEVIGDVVEIGSYNYSEIELNIQHYSFKEWNRFNIYELAHKCKEWALEQGYNFKAYDKHYDVMKFDGYNFKCLAEFEADSEQQSVFDACQWILENKE